VELDGDVSRALKGLASKLASVSGERGAINAAIKDTVKASGLKMPQLAMPLRVIVTGRSQTPSIDAVLELIGRETVVARLASRLGSG
jgi:glutamyl-tRNA synthetase